ETILFLVLSSYEADDSIPKEINIFSSMRSMKVFGNFCCTRIIRCTSITLICSVKIVESSKYLPKCFPSIVTWVGSNLFGMRRVRGTIILVSEHLFPTLFRTTMQGLAFPCCSLPEPSNFTQTICPFLTSISTSLLLLSHHNFKKILLEKKQKNYKNLYYCHCLSFICWEIISFYFI